MVTWMVEECQSKDTTMSKTYITLDEKLVVLKCGTPNQGTAYVARTRTSDEDIYGNLIPVARSFVGDDASRYSDECPHCDYGNSNYEDEDNPTRCLTCDGTGAVFIIE